ncbi:MAG: hypothetical protein U0800_06050 [Isosphaeraceae bacterium]
MLNNADRSPIASGVGRLLDCPNGRSSLAEVLGIDIQGLDQQDNFGEVFTEPPPLPAPQQSGPHNPDGLGEGLLRRGLNGPSPTSAATPAASPAA